MARATMSHDQCVEEARRMDAMGFHAQADVWRKRALELKKEEGEKRLAKWKKKMGVRLQGSGVSITEWLEWAFSQYSIAERECAYVVLSCCSDKTWTFDYEADALEKIVQLVGWKEADRNRGRGCMEEDVGGGG